MNIELSNSIRGRFIKDYNLPIQLFRDDYFEYFIELYNNLFDTKSKLQLLEKCLINYGSEEAYFSAASKLRDDVISGVKGTKDYTKFNEMDMKSFQLPNSTFSKGDIYKPYNDGKSFISIDLVKANFQVMKTMGCVLNVKTYDELLEKFTDNPDLLNYFKNSKYLRQVIFGNFNPSRQVTMQKFYTKNILDWLINSNVFTENQIKIFTYDEIVVETDKKIDDLDEYIKKHTRLQTKSEFFTLEHRQDPISYYIKHLENELIEFRTVPIVYFAQVYKSYYNLPLNDYDYRFVYEDRVAQFINKKEGENNE